MSDSKISRNEFIQATVLGVDHGLARMGFALKPAGQDWALPLRVVAIDSEAGAIRAIRALIKEYQPGAVVIGLPLNSDPEQAGIVRRFARKAREGVQGVRWCFEDERESSEEAERLAEEGAAGTKRKTLRELATDDLAAKVILERYMAGLKA